jgi:SAM-dependent methyltransferase
MQLDIIKRVLRGIGIRRPLAPEHTNPAKRRAVSRFYLRGHGIEIGALHRPLPVRMGTKVSYVDRYSREDLRKEYPELRSYNLVKVDITDDGEKLQKIASGSQDFIIANHFLEHCRNPLRALETFLDRIKPNGILYIIVPDKRYTFDSKRDITNFAHIAGDYAGKNSDDPHFLEVAAGGKPRKITPELRRKAKEFKESKYSIHYHVWDFNAYTDFLLNAQKFFKATFETLVLMHNGDEIISVLKKIK